MRIQNYALLISLAMAGSAFCSSKTGMSDELYESLKKKAHTPNYTAKVIHIDHKGETITLETKEAKKKRVAKEKAAKEKAAKEKPDKK